MTPPPTGAGRCSWCREGRGYPCVCLDDCGGWRCAYAPADRTPPPTGPPAPVLASVPTGELLWFTIGWHLGHIAGRAWPAHIEDLESTR